MVDNKMQQFRLVFIHSLIERLLIISINNTMCAVLCHLAQHGVEALKPQKIVTAAINVNVHFVKPPKQVWHRQVVSQQKDARLL
jgi:hypothetical protein